ncbi:MAG: DUF1501 domain-containing protein [Singulisphaera sp.]
MSDWSRLSLSRPQESPRAKSCILLWLDGGPSHLETFDLKPDAPGEVRGPFHPIATSVPGIQVCELLPNTARVVDKLAIIRSMTSPLGEHGIANRYLMTGYKPSPVLEYPSYAVLAHVRGGRPLLPLRGDPRIAGERRVGFPGSGVSAVRDGRRSVDAGLPRA